VRVEHVDSSGVSDSAQVGDEVSVRAFVSLGELTPADVVVQLVHGRVTPEDTLVETAVQELTHAEVYERRHCFEGSVRLRRTGPFGYTVRVLPAGLGLVSPAELGLVTNA
jgi:starch phosphorylase